MGGGEEGMRDGGRISGSQDIIFWGERGHDFQENQRGISRCFQSIKGEQ